VTAFQGRVYSALRTIANGETRSYSAIARQIGEPKAARAVARAGSRLSGGGHGVGDGGRVHRRVDTKRDGFGELLRWLLAQDEDRGVDAQGLQRLLQGREVLVQRARPFLFSTSQPPAVAAACREAIRIMAEEPELIERLWSNTRRFKAELGRLGFDTGRSETPITPVILGDVETTIRFSGRLFDEGVFGTSVVFPTVALDRSRIRTIVTAAHTDEMLDRALGAFDRVGRELGVIAG